jgi:hypothetical protein
MQPLVVHLQGDEAWSDLPAHAGVEVDVTKPVQVAVVDRGMASDRPSVVIRIDLADGRVVLARTSALLFCGAGRIIQGKYPGLFE